MQKLIFTLFFSFCALFSQEIKVVSYNVENLFDLNYDKTEYKEYIPNSKSNWNTTTQRKKRDNIARVLNEINADIIALQEIESKKALSSLLNKLPQYPYHAFVKNRGSSVGLAVISKYPILKNQKIPIHNSRVNRPIQEVDINIKNQTLKIFNNHWASKRQRESQRVNFAMHLQKRINELHPNKDYLLMGDFNSNYNEYETIRLEKKINDTNSLTGINHVLNSMIDHQPIKKENILNHQKKVHYNPWYELNFNNRFSNKYRGHNTTPDNILLSPALFDTHSFSYVNNSFEVFKPDYLYKNKIINRWKLNYKTKKHLGKGFSDHLPIIAKLSLAPYQKKKEKKASSIADIYTLKNIPDSLVLEKVTVTYKHNNHAIIKAKNSRSIFLYNCAQNLEIGFMYDLNVLKVKEHYGLKEIVKIKIKQKYNFSSEYKKFYQNANTIHLHNPQYQNEVITNLKATFQKGYLHYNNQKIKLYSKDKTLLPKNGQNVTIISGHLGFFKNKAQIIIYKKSDIRAH